jgi:hypothetical protein
MPFETENINGIYTTNNAMKKLIICRPSHYWQQWRALLSSQEQHRKNLLSREGKLPTTRNGAPDMRHKKPLPLPLPPVKAPET